MPARAQASAPADAAPATEAAPAPRPPVARSSAPRINTDVTAPAQPRPRPRDPRDRAYMDGGMAITPGFSGGFGQGTVRAPSAELAPRPNLDLELRPPPRGPETATISPTMIHPRIPGRGSASEGAVTQREQRLLQAPAPGARLSVPMSW